MRKRILLLEDEQAHADTLLYALQSEAFEVVHVRLAADALEAFRSRCPDLANLDVGVPDGSGFDVCRTIRKTSEMPIVFLTARHEEIDRVLGLELGADDYVVKPFSPREVCARVRAILRRSGADGSGVGRCAGRVGPHGGRAREAAARQIARARRAGRVDPPPQHALFDPLGELTHAHGSAAALRRACGVMGSTQ